MPRGEVFHRIWLSMSSDAPGPVACVFDAYGTLFDFRGRVQQHVATVAPSADAALLVTRWRETQLQYTWLRSLQGRYVNFECVTADALDYALESLSIVNAGLRDELLDLYWTVPVFDDAKHALMKLHGSGVRCLILSNGTERMIEAAAQAAGVRGLVDTIFSADAVGVYKPDARVYRLAVDALDAPPERILFVSANGWDAYGASAFGYRVVWCNRAGQTRERLPGGPEQEVRSLDEIEEVLASASSLDCET